ncbi:MAG: sigma-70 family RNA polymerase sigma factor [Microlunatus sp.]
MTAKPPYEELVRDHGVRVWRVCRAILGPTDTDDAWSETFLAGLRAYPELSPGADHGAWLATIAYRKAIDAVRARQRRAAPTDDIDQGPRSTGSPLTQSPLGQPGAGPDADLVDAVRSLPDKQRLAVTLHYLADLPYAQVAAEVGGTPDAARRAASDGLRTLRKRLASPTSGEPR